MKVYPNEGEPFTVDTATRNMGTTGINVSSRAGYIKEIRYFLDCVKEDREPDMVKEEQLLDVVALLEQEYKQR